MDDGYPDCSFTCGDVYISIEDNRSPQVDPKGNVVGPRRRLSPAQWAQLIAAIAAAIAQILGGFTASAKDTASEPKGAKAG